VKIDTSLQIICPKCGGTTVKSTGNGQYSCGSKDPNNNNKQCNHFFTASHSAIGKKVKINKPQSVWDGYKGKIESIGTDPKYPVVVKFIINKQVYSDSFHPVYLEEV